MVDPEIASNIFLTLLAACSIFILNCLILQKDNIEIRWSVFLSIVYQKAPQNRSLRVLITTGVQQK